MSRHLGLTLGLLALSAVVLVACGDDDTTAPVGAVPADLTITVINQDTGFRQVANLRCDDEGRVGTGYLEDDAEAACELLDEIPEARTRLVEGEPPDRVCAQVYGGPERAEVRGQLEGQDVDAVIERNDGCGIADWNLLMPLLPAPEDV